MQQRALRHLAIWTLILVGFLLAVWITGNALTPFVLGAAIAYLLDPLVTRLQRLGMGRVWATVTIAAVLVLVLVALMLAILPLIVSQTRALIAAFPDLVQGFQNLVAQVMPDLLKEGSVLNRGFEGLRGLAEARGIDWLRTALSQSLAVLDAVLIVVLAPVVAFYLLLDWPRLIARIDALVPRAHLTTIRRLAHEIDQALAGFVRGQLSVMLIQGSFYAVALALTGLQFGVAIGAIAGLLSFIPYVGAFVGGALAIGFALYQFWSEPWMIGVVAVIFLIGQVVEGNYLTPRLVGGSVGLHPVWLLFALAAFGAVLGFVGLMIAVPLAASIGVLGRFTIERYLQSEIYTGGPGDPDK